jgi:S-adenosyl-L-methionine hydrolase (adenosine-forming)
MARPITFLSDYGDRDEFAGVCRAVMARISPDARIIDLTHGIGRHDVRAGALVLAASLPYAPPGVHLAVVDPGVGTPRRAVAVRAAESERVLVGPDNGLLWPAIERLGGPVEAVDVSLSRFRLEPISATFHGRDLFAPVAAHIAAGASPREAGELLGADELVRLEVSEARIEPGPVVAATVARTDGFGNAILDLAEAKLPESGLGLGRSLRVVAGGEERGAIFTRTFADVPEGGLLLYVDSSGSAALAVNRGSAATDLGLGAGDEVVLRPE